MAVNKKMKLSIFYYSVFLLIKGKLNIDNDKIMR